MTAYAKIRKDILETIGRSSSPSPLLFGLDGPACAGKSTLASMVSQDLNLPTIPMDHFFLRPSQRTKDRLEETGGYIDYERFIDQVLHPLSLGKTFTYQIYDCQTQSLRPGPLLDPSAYPAFLIEGVYALHPCFRPYFHRTYFLDIPRDLQIRRLQERETPASYKRFLTDFLPRERAYFDVFAISSHADLLA